MGLVRALVIGVLSLLVTSVSLEAQVPLPPPVTGADRLDFGACVARDAPVAGDPDDPDRPQGIGGFQSPMTFVRNAVVCAEAYADSVILPRFGFPLFRMLSVIIVIWTGITMMLAQRFDFSEVLSLIFLMTFLLMILMSYQNLFGPLIGDPIWGDTSFPLLIASLGRTVADPLVEGVWETVNDEWTRGLFIFKPESATALTLAARTTLTAAGGDAGDCAYGVCAPTAADSSAGLAFEIIFGFFFFLAIILGAIPLLVAYFSYVWGYFSLIVIVLVGPLMVPWGLLPQTQFLFWGWVRSIIAATFQMMIGAAVFVISGTLLLTPLRRYTASLTEMMAESQDLSAGAIFSQGGSMILEFLPLALIAILGAFKGGEITGMILSGGGVPSSGLGDRARGAGQAKGAAMGAARGASSVARGGAALAAGAASGGAALAAGAGRAVLSAATKTK